MLTLDIFKKILSYNLTLFYHSQKIGEESYLSKKLLAHLSKQFLDCLHLCKKHSVHLEFCSKKQIDSTMKKMALLVEKGILAQMTFSRPKAADKESHVIGYSAERFGVEKEHEKEIIKSI